MKTFAVERSIDILYEFYVKEGGRGPWDLLGHIASNNYTFDIVPHLLTRASDPKAVVRAFRKRHSKMKQQRKSSRIVSREYELTTGAEIVDRESDLPKLGPLVGAGKERMTRSAHRYLTSKDPEDMSVSMGHLSCHVFNCPPCQNRDFLNCKNGQRGDNRP
eukprot:UN26293